MAPCARPHACKMHPPLYELSVPTHTSVCARGSYVHVHYREGARRLSSATSPQPSRHLLPAVQQRSRGVAWHTTAAPSSKAPSLERGACLLCWHTTLCTGVRYDTDTDVRGT